MPINPNKLSKNKSSSSIRGNYLTQKEAIDYAAKMGMTDSIRGIQQIYGNITNSEDLLEKLKVKDEKLHQIFENEEYGGKALAAWMGSAIALDPVGVIPYLGWARKARQMQKGASYGASLGQNIRNTAGISAAWSGVGYYGENDLSRGEGMLLGGTLGGGLGYLTGKVSRAVNKSMSPNRKQKQAMAAKESAETLRKGEALTPEEVKAAQDAVVKTLNEEGPNTLSKSISGLNIRKNYESIVGEKVWNTMVNNWGSGLVGLAAASGGYSALDDPDASELAKFGAAIALGLASGGSAKLLGKIELKDGSSLSEFISKGMVDNYGLEEGYIKLKKDSFSQVNSLKQQFLDIVRATDEVLTKDEQQVLYAMIHGVMDDVPNLKGLSDAAKKVIKETGRQLVDVGLLEKSTWIKNADRYLHRSYDSKLLKKADGTQGIRAAREFKIIGDQLKPRGFIKLTTKKSFETKPHWKKEGWEIINEDDLDNVIVRRQLTKQERLDRGEIENASFAIAETGRLMTHDLSVYKLFDNISKSKFALTEENFLKGAAAGEIVENAWKLVPISSRYKGKAHEIYEYGNLKGMYVPEAVYNDITRLIPTTKNDFSKLIGSKYLTAMRTWKKSKTAWNPTVHVNNTMSNIMMYDHADGAYKYISRGAAELKKGLDQRTDATIFRMAREDGVLDSDILSRELNDQTMGALEKASKELSVKGRNELHGSINYSKKLGGFFTKTYDATFRKMEDFYQAEDQVFRMALYMDRLSKGASRADAAADAKKWFIDYDINAPAINFLKNTATPFLSYTYRVVPLLAETAAKRPWKFAKWAALGYTANELGNKYGVGDSEAEKRLLDPRYKQKMFGVPFMPGTTIKTPFGSGRDKDIPVYIDTTRFIPGGDIFTMGDKGIPLPIPVPFSKAITGQQKFLRTPSALNPNFGIAGEVLAPMMFGVDSFTHEKLKNLGMGNDEIIKMTHVLAKLNPNIPAPYIFPEKYESYSSKRIREAFEKKTEDYAPEYSNFEAVMSSFGFKLTPVDMAKLLRIQDSNFREIYSQARRDYFKIMKDYQSNPSEKAYEETQKKLDRIYEQLDNAQRIYSSKRTGKVEGGVISKDFPVSDVKQDPKKRIDPFAQKSYDETRKGFALGGDVDVFEPLSEQIEQLASMQSSEEGSLLQGGVMLMETLKRKAKRREFQEGGRVLKALQALAKDGTFTFEPEKGAEILDKETNLGTGTYEPDYLANKGDGKAKFVMMVYENAKALGLKHPEWIASQAAAESRYGASPLAQGSNNLFGIKLREGEEGPAKMYPTKEQYADGLKKEMANFREFNSVDESLQGYDTFLRTGVNDAGEPRYDKALAAPTGPQYIQELKNAGYATDDDYVNLVTDVHNQYFGNK